MAEQKQYGLELTEQRNALREEQEQHNQAVAVLEQEVEQRKRQQFLMRQELNETSLLGSSSNRRPKHYRSWKKAAKGISTG